MFELQVAQILTIYEVDYLKLSHLEKRKATPALIINLLLLLRQT